jgi:hypothetical protein
MTRFLVELRALSRSAQSMKLLIRNIPAVHWREQLLPHRIVAVITEIFLFN